MGMVTTSKVFPLGFMVNMGMIETPILGYLKLRMHFQLFVE